MKYAEASLRPVFERQNQEILRWEKARQPNRWTDRARYNSAKLPPLASLSRTNPDIIEPMDVRDYPKAEFRPQAHPALLRNRSDHTGDMDALDPATMTKIRAAVRSELYRRNGATAEDAEDICSDCMVALLYRVSEGEPHHNLTADIAAPDAYVAAIARRACSAWSRRRHPAFYRLRIRLRYLLNKDARFAIWQDANAEWICGLAEWERATSRPKQIDADFWDFVPRASKPAEVLAGIFRQSCHPLHFNDLARICARLWAIEDTPHTLEAVDTASLDDVRMESSLDRRTRLKRLWVEVRALPPRQCAALLLNLRSADGDCATQLLVVTGAATVREIAAAMAMPLEILAELWGRLPLNDLQIAERMKITRQQVINLRKCARERLRRRLGTE